MKKLIISGFATSFLIFNTLMPTIAPTQGKTTLPIVEDLKKKLEMPDETPFPREPSEVAKLTHKIYLLSQEKYNLRNQAQPEFEKDLELKQLKEEKTNLNKKSNEFHVKLAEREKILETTDASLNTLKKEQQTVSSKLGEIRKKIDAKEFAIAKGKFPKIEKIKEERDQLSSETIKSKFPNRERNIKLQELWSELNELKKQTKPEFEKDEELKNLYEQSSKQMEIYRNLTNKIKSRRNAMRIEDTIYQNLKNEQQETMKKSAEIANQIRIKEEKIIETKFPHIKKQEEELQKQISELEKKRRETIKELGMESLIR